MRRWAVFVSVVVLLVLYTGLQLGLLAPTAPVGAVWAADVLFFWLLIGWQLSHRAGLAGRSRAAAAFGWGAAVATGVWATYVLLSLPLSLAALLRLGPPRALWLSAAGGSAVLAALGLRQALSGPVVREVEVPLAALPRALEGLRIVQISDLHVGPLIGARYLESVVSRVEALAPDLIAVTGDVADATVAQLAGQLGALRRLRAPLGAYFVTGNHEYYWGAEPWVRQMAELGLTPLLDENRVVERGGARLLVGGVTDPAAPSFVPTHRCDPARAARGEADLKILLAHRPDESGCAAAEAAGFALQLSGHTHGGQFFPFSILVGLAHRYKKGLYRHGRLWVYVNSGTGYWGPPHRFSVPAEITLLRLARA